MPGKLRENFLKFIGVNEEIEDNEYVENNEPTYSTKKQSDFEQHGRNSSRRASTPATIGSSRVSDGSPRVSPMPSSNNSQNSFVRMVVFQPQTYEDTQTIIDNLKAKKPVIVNLETLNVDVAQRVLDFMSGAIYALDGNVRKVSKGIFLLAPEGVDIAGNFGSDFSSPQRTTKSPFTTPRV